MTADVMEGSTLTLQGGLPHICVCICTFKRPLLLRRLLDELDDQATDGLFTYSIVVADNDKAESARSRVEEFGASTSVPILYCVEPERGIAHTRNQVLSKSVGDFFALIDDDEVPIRGCHIFDHCDSWETSSEQFQASLIANQRALTALFPQAVFHSMSYPFSVPTPRNKCIAGCLFDCCRGRGDFRNAGTADLKFLSSHFLERKLGGPEAALQAIENNRKECGWLIFSSHDLSGDPSPFGWTPEHFETVVRAGVDSGTCILPVFEALKRLIPMRSSLRDTRFHD